MALEDKLDALVCAIHMLVGQMQAERAADLLQGHYDATIDQWLSDDPGQGDEEFNQESALLYAPVKRARERAAGLCGGGR